MNDGDRILGIIREADEYRRKTLNLQASENVLSPDVRAALSSDFASRYSHLEESGHNSYGGTRYAEEIFGIAEELAREVFGSENAEVRPIGGHVAVLASILASCSKGDTIMSVGTSSGGYPGYMKDYIPDMLSLRNADIPFDDESQDIRLDLLEDEVRRLKPSAIILGQSAFVKPYDLKGVREIIDSSARGASLIYDGSHVMGLIAGKSFQSDVMEHADILLGSTHKSFFGPQGGLILTQNRNLMDKIRKQLIWKTMDNYHPNRVAALAVALAEMKEKGKKYAELVSSNSRNLAAELHRGGIGIRFAPWYSYSHQVILDMQWMHDTGTTPLSFSRKLEESGIIVDRDGRVGTSEISHMGLTDMKAVADLVLSSIAGNNVKNLAEVMVMQAPGL